MYKDSKDLMAQLKNSNLNLPEFIIEVEKELYSRSKEDILKDMAQVLAVMSHSALATSKGDQHHGLIIGGDSNKLQAYTKEGKSYSGALITNAMSMAFSTSELNASMGKICAAPTAGSSGILPAAILSAKEKLALSDKTLIEGLLVASVIGEIITRNATVSGAEGGCQAECGSAAAMAAGALIYFQEGSVEMIFHGAAIAIKNIMGLVCDPIAGLVESPCAKRNASGVVNAIISADMALAGVESIIPFDEVVEAMYKVGKALPATLRETALGGIAVTATALDITDQIYNKK